MKPACTIGALLLLLVEASRARSQLHASDPPKHISDSIGMKFVWIPPGSFMMGSPKDEQARRENETLHKATLTKGFYLGVYTVTQEQWRAVMGGNRSHHRGQKNLPVENVSWDACQSFLESISKKEGRVYRLPTEAEWEYACRAGTTTPFHFGSTISTAQANFNGSYSPYGNGLAGVFRKKTMPVGTFPANSWGLYDMHGNVWQWCADTYHEYSEGAEIDPNLSQAGPKEVPPKIAELVRRLSSVKFSERQAAAKDLTGIGRPAIPALRKAAKEAPDLETRRRAEQVLSVLVPRYPERIREHVLRGGSFLDQAAVLRSAYRVKFLQTYTNYDVGFRAVRSVGPGQR